MTVGAGGRRRGAQLGWHHAASNSLTVTELCHPGLQDPPPGQDGRNAGRGQ